ncbi:MAG: zinc-ribbon domain-containing protein, partial [Mailhella sp.]|nr:zinc-ribbon domain-containing protein [Mailhella sp.]
MNVTCPQCSTVYRLPDEKAKAGAKLRCSICRCVFVLPENDELLELPAEKPTDSLALVDDIPAAMVAVQTAQPFDDASQSLALGDHPSADAHHGVSSDSLDMGAPYQGYADNAQFADASLVQEDLEALDLPEKKKAPFEGAFGLLLCIAIILGGIWAWKHTPYLDGLKALIMPVAPIETASEAPQSLIEKLEIVSHQSYQVKNEKLGTLTVIEGRIRNNFTESRELIRLEAELLDSEGKALATQTQVAGVS